MFEFFICFFQVKDLIDEGNRCKQRNIILGNGKKKPKVQALYDYAEKSNREVSAISKSTIIYFYIFCTSN